MEDQVIITACLRGNGEDFKKIVDKYQGPVMAVAVNILGNREDAEDACQETFIQVFRNLEHFDARRSFRNWLYTILYHRCLDQLKKKRRFRNLAGKIKVQPSGRFAAQAYDPEEKKQLSQEILKHLSPKERTVLCLWANEGFTAVEISDVLHCTASTARVYLFNARKKVKILLEKKA
jgi:RNA polymerase sigma-70 factor (ECF subfamily)